VAVKFYAARTVMSACRSGHLEAGEVVRDVGDGILARMELRRRRRRVTDAGVAGCRGDILRRGLDVQRRPWTPTQTTASAAPRRKRQ
jgi:hypothetical protein